MKRKETLLGQMGQNEDAAPLDAPDFPPVQKAALIGVAIGGVLLVAYTLLGFFLVPWVIGQQLDKAVAGNTTLSLTVDRIGFNPFTLNTRIEGVSGVDSEGALLVGLERLEVNLQVSSLFRGGPVFRQIRLTHPVLNIRRNADGDLNLQNVLRKREAGSAEDDVGDNRELPFVLVEAFALEQGRVTYRDSSTDPSFEQELSPISFELADFSTRAGRKNNLSLVAENTTDGVIRWTGNVGFEPFTSRGQVEINNLRIHNFSPYFSPYVNFEILESLVRFSFTYDLDFGKEDNPLSLADGQMLLQNLSIHPLTGEERLIFLDALSLTDIQADLLPRRISVGSLTARDGEVSLVQTADREINLLQAFRLNPVDSGEPVAPDPGGMGKAVADSRESWDLRLEQLRIENYVIRVLDQSLSVPAETAITMVSMQASGLSGDLSEPVPFSIVYQLGESGSLELEGSALPDPLETTIQVTAREIPVTLAAPYLRDSLSLNTQSGSLNAEGELSMQAGENGEAPQVTFLGSLGLNDLRATHLLDEAASYSATSVAVHDLNVQSRPIAVSTGEVLLVQPSVTLVRQAEGLLLLPGPAEVKTASPGSAAVEEPVQDGAVKPEASPTTPSPLALSVARITIREGAATLLDESLQPAFESGLRDISLELSNLSNFQDTAATLKMEGILDEASRLALTGKVNPLQHFEDTALTLRLDPLNLTRLNPYSEKFLGRRIQRGKLDVNMDYAVVDRMVKGENRFRFDQIQMGERVDSPEAMNLPLDLAVSLLRDSSGVMEIDVPVSGNLDDPNFSLGGVIMRAFTNLIAKAATAPFSIIGNLVSSDKPLNFVAFQPGSSQLSLDEVEKLEQLSKALSQRPQLRLNLFATLNRLVDSAAMRRLALLESLKIMQERNADLPQGDFQEDQDLYAWLLAMVGDRPELEAISRSVLRTPAVAGAGGALLLAGGDSEEPETGSEDLSGQSPGSPEEKPAVETVITREERVLEVGEVAAVPGFFDRLFGGRGALARPENDPITVEVVRTESAPTPVQRPQPGAESRDEPEKISGAQAADPLPPELPPLEMLERAALSRISIQEEDLAWLARQRENRVVTFLTENMGLSRDRVFVIDAPADAEGQAQVQFRLE